MSGCPAFSFGTTATHGVVGLAEKMREFHLSQEDRLVRKTVSTCNEVGNDVHLKIKISHSLTLQNRLTESLNWRANSL